ncbi:MAG: hypothetical protein AAGI01_12355 [Myxococcota bacterium]
MPTPRLTLIDCTSRERGHSSWRHIHPLPDLFRVAVRAPWAAIRGTLMEVLRDPSLEDELAHGVITVYADDEHTLLTDDLDAPALHHLHWEHVMGELGAHGVVFGHDTLSRELFFTKFLDGQLVYSWCDAPWPGESIALSVRDDERYIYEDARHHALRVLGLPEDARTLDRVAFFEHLLAEEGLPCALPRAEAIDYIHTGA